MPDRSPGPGWGGPGARGGIAGPVPGIAVGAPEGGGRAAAAEKGQPARQPPNVQGLNKYPATDHPLTPTIRT